MNKTYNWHIGFRCMLGLAAGQSEALVPLILSQSLLSGGARTLSALTLTSCTDAFPTEEAFFLHERARVLSWQSVLQIIVR